jgi:hypothetical protein
MDITDYIIRYENGDLSPDETIALFQKLIDTGMAWRLQGSYGRAAQAMIEAGLCKRLPTMREVDPERAASKVQGL